ncbi:hypothetical protein ACFQV2_13945 [Actinokineospora soli]|uniref:Uncharacterized protein n=1 Tax=Actinokineospora soli TaxID=1048753 RepID=A0ABW2TL40_9PSEU
MVKVIAAIGALAHEEVGSGDPLDGLPHLALVAVAGLLACAGVAQRTRSHIAE